MILRDYRFFVEPIQDREIGLCHELIIEQIIRDESRRRSGTCRCPGSVGPLLDFELGMPLDGSNVEIYGKREIVLPFPVCEFVSNFVH